MCLRLEPSVRNDLRVILPHTSFPHGKQWFRLSDPSIFNCIHYSKVYQSFWILSSILGGLMFFEEYTTMTFLQQVCPMQDPTNPQLRVCVVHVQMCDGFSFLVFFGLCLLQVMFAVGCLITFAGIAVLLTGDTCSARMQRVLCHDSALSYLYLWCCWFALYRGNGHQGFSGGR